MTTTTDYEQALALIRQLDRSQRARLVAEVVQELAAEPVSSPQPHRDPRVTLAEIRAHFATLGPVAPTMGEQIEADRQQRADMLEGKVSTTDVHH